MLTEKCFISKKNLKEIVQICKKISKQKVKNIEGEDLQKSMVKTKL